MENDFFAHLVGNCTISKIGVIQPDLDLISVSFLFMGLDLNVQVPRQFLVDKNGVLVYSVGEMVMLNCILCGDSSIKTFDNRTFVKQNLAVRSIIELKKLNGK